MAQRQLAAIMFTDLVGFSALTQRDEALALELLETHWYLLRPIISDFDGTEIKTIGDAFLVEFPSALSAVNAALAMQKRVTRYNGEVDHDHRIEIRIGVHLGDVERHDGDLFGDGVNIASRIHPLAKPGGICISEPVYALVHNKIEVPFHSMGVQRLKNITQPVVVYSNTSTPATAGNRPWTRTVTTVLGVIAFVGLLTFLTIAYLEDDESTVAEKPVHEPAGESDVTLTTGEKKSVAVLPFVNRSTNKDDMFFTDGLHDDLITLLSKITDMRVISRTSVMGYRDTQKRMNAIGEELGVTTLLEGGVQRAGNKVRINVQLINAETDEHLWAEIYDRELTAANIFAIQTEIATAIANALHATLSTEEKERLAMVPTEDLAAYEAYLLGKQRMAKRTIGGLAEALVYFQQATKLDPGFALAYVGMADAYQLQLIYSGAPREETNRKAEDAIHKALSLDDRMGEAYTSLGFLKWARNDYAGAEASFKRALGLSPNYATTYHWYGSMLQEQGKEQAASEMMQKALALDPLSLVINSNAAQHNIMDGRVNVAMSIYKKMMEIEPTSSQGYAGVARVHMAVNGRLDEAWTWSKQAVSLDPGSPQYNALHAALYLTLDDRNTAQCWADRAIALGPEGYLSNLIISFLHEINGRYEEVARSAKVLVDAYPNSDDGLRFLRNIEIRAGKPERARALYAKYMPALINDVPDINRKNLAAAVDLAYVLQMTGENERARLLLDRSLALIHSGLNRMDFTGYGIADVHIHALRGEKEKALKLMQKAIDEGWRIGWWYHLEHAPNLDPVRNDPQFQAMSKQIRDDMAAQLARVRAMETKEDRCISESGHI